MGNRNFKFTATKFIRPGNELSLSYLTRFNKDTLAGHGTAQVKCSLASFDGAANSSTALPTEKANGSFDPVPHKYHTQIRLMIYADELRCDWDSRCSESDIISTSSSHSGSHGDFHRQSLILLVYTE